MAAMSFMIDFQAKCNKVSPNIIPWAYKPKGLIVRVKIKLRK